MKQRKLTATQAQALMRKITAVRDVEYRSDETIACTDVGSRSYRLVYDTDLKFTGVAHRIYQ